MRTLGYFSIGVRTVVYSLVPQKMKKRIQMGRLKKLVKYAKKNSPFYAELYKNIGDDFKVSDLPPTTKQILMDNFDGVLTDQNINLKDIKEFISVPENVDKRVGGKYMVATTSGSTGTPAILLQERTSENLTSALTFMKVFHMQCPVAMVCCQNYGQDYGIVTQNLNSSKIIEKIVRVIEARQHPDDIIRQLNEFKPKVITGYTGTLALLFDDRDVTEKINYRPKLVLTGGEYLSKTTRATLEKGFGCPVHTLYTCTESAPMAFECKENHLHINEDWTIFESVDKDNNPVPSGVLGDKVLMTNLSNYIQPKIRYELTDRVILHHETCACGKKGLWVEVEGRVTDVLYFEENAQEIGVPPMSIHDFFEDTPGVSWFQGILHPFNVMEIRLNVLDGYDRKAVFDEITRQLDDYLKTVFHINSFSAFLSEKSPEINPKTRKFRQFYQVDTPAQIK